MNKEQGTALQLWGETLHLLKEDKWIAVLQCLEGRQSSERTNVDVVNDVVRQITVQKKGRVVSCLKKKSNDQAGSSIQQ